MWKVDKCLCILNIWSWKMSGLYIWRSLTANYSNLRFMGVRKIIWRWAKSKMVAEYESDIIYILRKETNNFLITGNWKEHFRLWMVNLFEIHELLWCIKDFIFRQIKVSFKISDRSFTLFSIARMNMKLHLILSPVLYLFYA